MRLVSVKYQDSCIYIELGFEKETHERLQSIRNIYVKYKIQAFSQSIQEIYLVKKKNLILLRTRLILIVNVDIIHAPEDSYFILDTLKISFLDNNRQSMKIGTRYLIADIESYEKPHIKTKIKSKPVKVSKSQDSITNNYSEEVSNVSDNKKVYTETPISDNGLKIMEVRQNPQEMLKSVEQHIESQIDEQFELLNKNLKQIYIETLNLLITNLPRPIDTGDLQFNEALINSVRKYMNHELIAIEGE